MDPSSSSSSSSQSTYGRQNVFYLRVSARLVLPCILYLDPRHVLWLNTHPSVFHTALKFLKNRIVPKLEKEAKIKKVRLMRRRGGARDQGQWIEKECWGEMSGKESIDVGHQTDYTVAYFFRKTETRHAVLLKEKEVIFPDFDGSSSSVKEGKKRARVDPEEEERLASDGIEIKPDPEDEEEERRRVLLREPSADSDEPLQEQRPDEEEDQKPKFKLKVRYKGFTIFSKTLILILEPSKSARERSPDLFQASQSATPRRQLSLTPAVGSQQHRFSATPGVDPRSAYARGDREDTAASMRDASSGRRATPLFRGMSTTPSEEGTPAPFDSRVMPPPNRARRPAAGNDERLATPSVAGDFDDEGGSPPWDSDEDEGGESFAERVFSQRPSSGADTLEQSGGIGGED